jgi:phage gp16-like protein
MSQEIFKTKKCDTTRGPQSWKVNEIKEMCTVLRIPYKSHDNKMDLCKKISKYFKRLNGESVSPGVSPVSEQQINSPVSEQQINSPVPEQKINSPVLNSGMPSFHLKTCKDARGPKSWSVNELKQMCLKLNISFKTSMTKNELCALIEKYLKMYPHPIENPVSQTVPLLIQEPQSVPVPEQKINLPVLNSGMPSFHSKTCKDSRGPKSWTVNELKQMCSKLNITFKSSMTKNELCALIEKYLKRYPDSIENPVSQTVPLLIQTEPPQHSYKDKMILNSLKPKQNINELVSINDLNLESLKERFIQNNCKTGKWTLAEIHEICNKLDIQYTSQDDKSSLCFKIENALFNSANKEQNIEYLKKYNMPSIQKVFNNNECKNGILPNNYSVDELKDIAKIFNIKTNAFTSKTNLCDLIENVIHTSDVNELVSNIIKSTKKQESSEVVDIPRAEKLHDIIDELKDLEQDVDISKQEFIDTPTKEKLNVVVDELKNLEQNVNIAKQEVKQLHDNETEMFFDDLIENSINQEFPEEDLKSTLTIDEESNLINLEDELKELEQEVKNEEKQITDAPEFINLLKKIDLEDLKMPDELKNKFIDEEDEVIDFGQFDDE